MSLRNIRYMQSIEFKDRQGSFGFFCAQAVEFLTEFREECRKGWNTLFAGHAKPQTATQMMLDFTAAIKPFWACANIELFQG